jgi:hypothetical protein
MDLLYAQMMSRAILKRLSCSAILQACGERSAPATVSWRLSFVTVSFAHILDYQCGGAHLVSVIEIATSAKNPRLS